MIYRFRPPSGNEFKNYLHFKKAIARSGFKVFVPLRGMSLKTYNHRLSHILIEDCFRPPTSVAKCLLGLGNEFKNNEKEEMLEEEKELAFSSPFGE